MATAEHGNPGPARGQALRVPGLVPGVAAAAAVAATAYLLAKLVPLLGAPVLALALGMAIGNAVHPGERLRPGVSFAARDVLQAAIVLLGATLSLSEVAHVGRATLPVMLGSLAAALLVAAVAGRLLAVPGRLRILVGVGTGICGASAIGAVAPIVGAAEAEIAYAISTIFAFNLVAVILFPPLGHLLGLGQHAFGLWAGTAVNDTSSVVAAAYAYGDAAGAYAVVVKLTRTTMIVPIAAVLSVAAARGGRARSTRWTSTVPWFLLLFAGASALDSLGLFGHSTRHALARAAVALMTVALAGVGLSSRLGAVRRAGFRPLLLGTLVWVAVAGTSLALERATGAW